MHVSLHYMVLYLYGSLPYRVINLLYLIWFFTLHGSLITLQGSLPYMHVSLPLFGSSKLYMVLYQIWFFKLPDMVLNLTWFFTF